MLQKNMDTVIAIVIHLLVVVALVHADCPRDVDPCDSSEYTHLDEFTRSVNYTTEGSVSESDYGLPMRWYRSISGAGGDMPTSPVTTGQCNAYAPIWLTTDLPSEADGIVDIPACASFVDNDCIREYPVPVKNCGEYRVYCLAPTDDSYDRYCMGTEIHCSEGYWSENGFTPGCIEEICPRDVDPCSSDVYTEMDEPTRSINYTVDATNSHDYASTTTWYRSVSGAGGDMPTSPVPTGQCDAYAPIWINGTLPEQSDGFVDLTGCASFLDNTCIREYRIPVKNCGTYNVYCLQNTRDAFDRYCMGSELECPDGFTSRSGFTPDCTEIPDTTTESDNNGGTNKLDDKDKVKYHAMIVAVSVVAGIALLVIAILAIVFIKSKKIVRINGHAPFGNISPPSGVSPAYSTTDNIPYKQDTGRMYAPPPYSLNDRYQAPVKATAPTAPSTQAQSWSTRPNSGTVRATIGSNAVAGAGSAGSGSPKYSTPYSRYGVDTARPASGASVASRSTGHDSPNY